MTLEGPGEVKWRETRLTVRVSTSVSIVQNTEKMGSLELGGGLEVIRPQMTWGALKQDKKVLNGHGEVMPHEESAKA